ncbi:hypothetical protein QAD02_020418 [Eretmocerus hayati]|uniref:Uncharacterized protein n=1 Tax=Eretmocerus hayati TaxID=131215 RepID=A0ACC2PM02_9HYME|nr:hypothetical protein QAD02_020418 [Eretmocerus hayati]
MLPSNGIIQLPMCVLWLAELEACLLNELKTIEMEREVYDQTPIAFVKICTTLFVWSLNSRFYAAKYSVLSGTQFGYQMMRSAKTTPLIVPTAETTRTSQNIQFTPGNSWRSIPVCFYGPPLASSPNSLDQSAIPVFRTAIHDTPGDMNLGVDAHGALQIYPSTKHISLKNYEDPPTIYDLVTFYVALSLIQVEANYSE